MCDWRRHVAYLLGASIDRRKSLDRSDAVRQFWPIYICITSLTTCGSTSDELSLQSAAYFVLKIPWSWIGLVSRKKSLMRASCMWLLILYARVYVKSKSFQIQTFLFPFESCWEAFRRTYIYIGDQRRACGKACGEPCGVYALLIIPYHTMIL